jgi:UDP-glucose 4-epimerase
VSGTVLITGGAGFIGSNLARGLAGRGDRVRILDDLSIGRTAYLTGVPHDFVLGSVADTAVVRSAVAGVDAIVHLAARAGIDDSVRDPLGTFEANVAWSVGLLDAARLAGVRRVVFASSNAAAGDHEPPSDETDLPHPLSPYGASKLAIEAYAQAYAATYGMAVCSLRFSNAYGPYSLHKRSVVAAWLRAALRGQPIEINGDGSQTRDFVHADDLAAAVIAALDAPEAAIAGELFQAGTGVETTVAQLADEIGRAVGRPVDIRHAPARVGDIARNVARVDKAAAVLGYRSAVAL